MTATVGLVLDTRAPVLRVEAEARVQPPEGWLVTVVSDEPVGDAAAALLDARGALASVGIEHLDARTLRVLVPTVEVAGGPATLLMRVADEVGNATQTSIPLDVLRPAAFNVTLDLIRGYDLDFTLAAGFETASQADPAFDFDSEVS